jgi:hypothetical protein
VRRVTGPALQSTALFSWHARIGSVAAASGDIGTFSRASSGTYVDTTGVINSAPYAGVRREARDWHGTGVRDSAGLLIESQRTNLCTQSEAFELWTLQNGATVTANQVVAPDGALSADLLNNPTAAGASGFGRDCTFPDNGEKCVSIFLKAGTATSTDVGLYEAQGPVWRHFVRVAWNSGVPTVTFLTGNGTIYPVVGLGNGWYRIAFSAKNVIAANTNVLYVYPSSSDAVAGTVYAWGAQVENAPSPTSYIATASSTITRSAETLTWAADWRPQAFGFRLEFIEGGLRHSNTLGNGGVFSINKDDGTGAYLLLGTYTDGIIPNVYALYHGNGVTSSGAAVGETTQIGDRVVLRGQLYSDGSVQLWQSVNGGAEVASGQGGTCPLASTWGNGAARLRLGANGASNVVGGSWFKRLKLVPGVPDASTLAAL